ncbi:ABC transporter ATP-binding protein [Dehalobacterium formicoaceticum]|uniref:Energy-coupling factor transporter ATPase n=1 Tax=Dehalobacterium formicoaceticum TaxID=51515 RepID=A0ABT1Y643_9FIRM|nr:ABC transporter ATP-binding protein [Dehalobacterium formicoaceticum]MCR6545575.1 energy-coupling factor transporter ATPase [Dehalobacterium formicoaceticum]
METIAQIKIEKLFFPQTANTALKNIDFKINKGDFIVITGGVASGKSVLLHTITGAIPHYHQGELEGKVTLMGQDIKDVSLNQMSRYVGYMMQEPQNQLISLDVYDDVSFGLGNMELPMEQIDEIVKDTLEFVGLRGFENRQTASLSGGQAQRVVLAGVLALRAPMLILDQPTAELDPRGRYELYQRLGHLNKTRDLTIVLVMDRIEEVITYANRVFYMEEGEIVREYFPEEYLKERNEELKKRFQNKSVVRGKNHQHRQEKEVVVNIKNASYRYPNNYTGCEDVNLKIYQGDFLAVIGLNGSGKSTLAKMIVGLLLPTKGTIDVFHESLIKENLNKIRSRIGFLFQNPDYQIFASSLREEVGFSLKLRGEKKEVMDRKIDESLEFVGLLKYKDLHPQRLSRGQRQLLALASVLVSDPELIIADEPTSGLDENQGYMIMDKLADLSRLGKTVLLITHDLTMAQNYSNRIVAMYNHRLQLDISTSKLKEHLKPLIDIDLDFGNIISFNNRDEERGG